MTRKIYTTLIVIGVLILTALIQINLINVIPLFGVVANIGVIVIAGFGFINGRTIGGLTGMVYGLIIDVVFSRTIGINLFLYSFLGACTGNISNKFSKDNKTAFVMIALTATVVFELINCFLVSTVNGSDIGFVRMIMIICVETAYNILLSSILYKFIRGLGEVVNRSKSSYYLL